HRMMFFAGAIQLLLPLVFWSVELLGRHTDLWAPLNTLIPITWAHGFIMLYGVFSFFIFGFLMTVYPRWMNGELVSKVAYTNTFAWLCIGILLFQIGIFFNITMAAIGIAIFLLGWAIGQIALFKVYKNAPTKNKNYESILNFALAAGWVGTAIFLLWLLTDEWSYQVFSLRVGLWIYLLPILFSVAHRMIPFFSSNIIRGYQNYQPMWTIKIMLASSISHLILETIQLTQWLFIADIPLAFVAILHSVKWKLKNSFTDRLLAVLHMAFLWLGFGMSLYSMQSLYLLFSGELILAKGPLHAITIGFFTTLLIAMASRVSLGHSGRKLILDQITWGLFLGILLTALLRVFADISALNSLFGLSLNIITSFIWIVCVGIWVIRFAPFYITARADGNPG
ncbi:MAG: NnrS family protein, partial [Gammaproteobacteria bacterium]|nr:NnrS family protein [Gammaproteobacteria bacterium]